jgi:hypothetical protein
MGDLTMMRLAAVLVALGAVAGHAQDPKKAKLDDFESELAGWAAFRLDESGFAEDSGAKLELTREAGKVKSGKGALSYTYELAAGKMRVLGRQSAPEISGTKSLRAWVKSSASTAIIFNLTEQGGASYQASVVCAAGAWQEVAVNLDEFTLDDPSKDSNGRLDLDEVASMQVIDIGSFLAAFLPDLKGSRTLWLDDVGFSPEAAPRTSGLGQATRVVPVYLVDTFETAVIRWAPVSLEFADPPKFNLFDAPVAIDKDAPRGGGKQSLKFSYPRKMGKFHGLMRTVEKVDLSKARGLDLWLKTSHDGTYVVTLEEKDGSRFQKMVELQAGDGWKAFSFEIGDFALADDSQDDNGKLDPDQLKQVAIADLSSLSGSELGEARLWIDEVRFALAP